MPQKNVLGGPLLTCSDEPKTGFYRTGRCEVGRDDRGLHAVCVQVTREFLEFSRAAGNDLSRSVGTFPGLQPGDRWCVCVARWQEALDAGVAPPVVLEATSEITLQLVSLDELKRHALDFEGN